MIAVWRGSFLLLVASWNKLIRIIWGFSVFFPLIYIYIYIYRERERERVRLCFSILPFSLFVLVVVRLKQMQDTAPALELFGLMMSTVWVPKPQLSNVQRVIGVNITANILKMLVLIAIWVCIIFSYILVAFLSFIFSFFLSSFFLSFFISFFDRFLLSISIYIYKVGRPSWCMTQTLSF